MLLSLVGGVIRAVVAVWVTGVMLAVAGHGHPCADVVADPALPFAA